MVEKESSAEKNKRHIRVGILGCLGSGKTTLSRLLKDRWNAAVVTEEYGNNPFLEKFYAKPQDNSFKSQLWFLENKVRQLHEDCNNCTEIIDPSFEMDRLYAYTQHKTGWMNEHEWNLYEDAYKFLLEEKNIKKPDFNIVITADYPTILKRVKRRAKNEDRFFERWMLKYYPDYLKHLSDAVLDWSIANSQNSLIINTTFKDMVNPDNHTELSRIEGHIALFVSRNIGKIIPPQYGNVGPSQYDGIPHISDGKVMR